MAKAGAKAAKQPQRAPRTKKPAPDAEKKTAEQTTQAAEQPDQAASQPQPWKVGRLLCVSRNLMKGDDVRAVQLALIAAGYSCGTNGANGVYGRETAQAVRRFQAFNRLIVDGKAGKYTVKTLGGVWDCQQAARQEPETYKQ